MPLYKVEFEGEVVIYSEGEPPGYYDIQEAIREELSGMGGGIDGLLIWDPERVTPKTHIGEWANSRPYERDDDKTCAEILAEEAEAEARRPPTPEEIEAAGQQRLIA
jgi:hypothetical protein